MLIMRITAPPRHRSAGGPARVPKKVITSALANIMDPRWWVRRSAEATAKRLLDELTGKGVCTDLPSVRSQLCGTVDKTRRALAVPQGAPKPGVPVLKQTEGHSEHTYLCAVAHRPMVGTGPVLKLEEVLREHVDTGSGRVQVPFRLILDWDAAREMFDATHAAENGWSHLRTLSGLARAEFGAFLGRAESQLAELGEIVSSYWRRWVERQIYEMVEVGALKWPGLGAQLEEFRGRGALRSPAMIMLAATQCKERVLAACGNEFEFKGPRRRQPRVDKPQSSPPPSSSLGHGASPKTPNASPLGVLVPPSSSRPGRTPRSERYRKSSARWKKLALKHRDEISALEAKAFVFIPFENGVYTDQLRLMFMSALSAGVSPEKAPDMVWDILALLGLLPTEPTESAKYARSWPSVSLVRTMHLEIGALSNIHVSDVLLNVVQQSAAIAMDEATKIGRSRFALGFFCNKDGPGSEILFYALGVLDLLGNTSEDELAAVREKLETLCEDQNMARKFRGLSEEERVSVDDLLKKIGASMTDSASTQQKTNRLLFEMVVEANVGADATEEEKARVRNEMRQFFCWLHKAINLVKASTKALKVGFSRDLQVLLDIDRRGDASDNTLEEDGSRPAEASKGHIAVWAIYKLLSKLFDGDQTRRGEVYDALLSTIKLEEEEASNQRAASQAAGEEAGPHTQRDIIELVRWVHLKGNREQAWCQLARQIARLVTDSRFGCGHCNACRAKYKSLRFAVEHDDTCEDTVLLCVVCYLNKKRDSKNAVPLNKLELCVIAYRAVPPQPRITITLDF